MKSQSGFLKFIIRSGFLAEGVVYLAVGLLALQVAVGLSGETGDTKGALQEIGRPIRGNAPGNPRCRSAELFGVEVRGDVQGP